MTTRLSTLLLSLVFLLSTFQVEQAQPLDEFSSDHNSTAPTTEEVSQPDAVTDGITLLSPRLDRPASLAGEPLWMTSDIHKPEPKPKDHVPSEVSAKDGRMGSRKPTKSGESNPRKPSPVALFADRKHMLCIRYRYLAGRDLYITNGYRTARKQAIAIGSNLRRYGTRYVISLYRSKSAIKEIVQAYKSNRRSRPIGAMTRVIENQVSRGIFISNHMRWRAVDVRSRGWHRARLSVLRQVAQSMGARVLVEANHYHVDL